MSEFPRSGPVLHPTDASEGARAAYPYARRLADLLGSEVRSFHVAAAEGGVPAASEFLAGRGDGGEQLEVRRGDRPHRVLLDRAEEIGAGAIVMGTHGRQGLRELVLGSVTERVIRGSSVPVLTVRPGMEGWAGDGPRRVLVGADLGPTMGRALRWAGAMAAAAGAELEAVHVVESPAAAVPSGKRRRIHDAYRELDAPEVGLSAQVVAGDPADRICQMGEETGAELVVTAPHGRSGPARLVLGSVTEAVVRRARCPVLTVPPEG